MSHKLNCWEFKNCGREPGGIMTGLLGVCPITEFWKLDGTNGGRAAGRACWEAMVQLGRRGDFNGTSSCLECPFYRRVHHEERQAVPEPADLVLT